VTFPVFSAGVVVDDDFCPVPVGYSDDPTSGMVGLWTDSDLAKTFYENRQVLGKWDISIVKIGDRHSLVHFLSDFLEVDEVMIDPPRKDYGRAIRVGKQAMIEGLNSCPDPCEDFTMLIVR